jgi:SWI/SNF-related matrix-associated actin-dependent regulator of chromatin subfamily A-like protein 1
MDGLAAFLNKRAEDYIRIDGRTASKDRHGRVQHFQTSSSCRVAILAITAAGIALTLTAASTVYFAELYWTPAALLQAEDRAHRIGQTSTVKITYLLAPHTADELLWPLLRQKMKLLGEIVEGSKENDFLASEDDSENAVRPSGNNSMVVLNDAGTLLKREPPTDEENEAEGDMNGTLRLHLYVWFVG